MFVKHDQASQARLPPPQIDDGKGTTAHSRMTAREAH